MTAVEACNSIFKTVERSFVLLMELRYLINISHDKGLNVFKLAISQDRSAPKCIKLKYAV